MQVKRTLSLVGLLVVSPAALAQPPSARSEPKREPVWVEPSPVPPFARPGAIQDRLEPGATGRKPSALTGELAGLRAVSMREGSAIVATRGTNRTIRPGDRLGDVVVKAIGSDRLVLEKSQELPGPALGQPPRTVTLTIVVTFDSTGQARVRKYVPLDGWAPPPEVR